MPTINVNDLPEFKIVKLVDLTEDSINNIAEAIVNKLNEPVRHGHWINDNGMYRCSVCNNLWAIAGAPEKWMYKEMKFCPNCGAKMDENERGK